MDGIGILRYTKRCMYGSPAQCVWYKEGAFVNSFDAEGNLLM